MATNNFIGKNIYKDKLNRTILYDKLTKKAYILKSSDEKQYSIYSKRFLFPIVAFALLFTYFDYLIGVGAAVFVGIITELFYRYRFLKGLQINKDFTPCGKEDYFDQVAKATSKQDLTMRIILYFALGIVLLAFGFVSEFDKIEWLFDIALVLFAFYMAYQNIITLQRKG